MKYRDGFLLQFIFYCLLWFYDDYIGLLISIIMAAVFAGLLVFALMAEAIEKSKVPRSYFKWMLLSILTPVLVSIIFTLLYAGKFDWLNEWG